MEIIQNDSVTQFTSKEFQEGISVHVVRLGLVAPYHQKIHGQVEVTWETLRTYAHSIMFHTRVYDKYIHF